MHWGNSNNDLLPRGSTEPKDIGVGYCYFMFCIFYDPWIEGLYVIRSTIPICDWSVTRAPTS